MDPTISGAILPEKSFQTIAVIVIVIVAVMVIVIIMVTRPKLAFSRPGLKWIVIWGFSQCLASLSLERI